MTGDIIKQFLVSLGFTIDKKSLGDFNAGIASAAKRVTALYASIKVMSAAVFYGISRVSEGFEEMGYQMRLIAPAIHKVLYLRQQMMLAYSKAGVNLHQVVRNAVLFNLSLAKTRYALEALYKGTAAKFFPMLTKQMDIFRGKIYANMPKLQRTLEKFILGLFAAFKATVILGQRVWSILERVYEFFAKLHRATDGWSTVVLGMVLAWKALNLAFISTPLGMVLTGLLAILALYDDFKTFKEGGESFFDWSKAVPYIDAAAKVMTQLTESTVLLFATLKPLGELLYNIATLNFSGVISSLQDLINKLGSLLSSEGFEKAMKLASLASPSTWAKAVMTDDFGGFSVADFWAKKMSGSEGAPPLGTSPGNTSNQNLSQQNSVIIHGAADANATGKAVGNEMGKQNADFLRNLTPRFQ